MMSDEAKTMEKMGLVNSGSYMVMPGPKFKKLYANNVTIGVTGYDMSLTFGEIVGVAETGQAVIEQKVKLNMSKEFVKALGNLITANLANYEAIFGEIKIIDVEGLELVTSDGKPATAKALPPKKPKASSPTSKKRRS